jgi:hypothetical protein
MQLENYMHFCCTGYDDRIIPNWTASKVKLRCKLLNNQSRRNTDIFVDNMTT